MWSRMLLRASQAATPLKRSFYVLLWRETRLAVPFCGLVIVWAIVASLCRISLTPETPVALFVLMLVTAECGLRTCRHDQQRRHGLFWSERGVSPLLVLITRNIVWFTVLIVSAISLLVIDLLPHQSRLFQSENRLFDIVQNIRMPASPVLQPSEFYTTSPDHWFQVQFCAVWLLGGFLISQLCSVWIRKPLPALFVSWVIFGCYNGWLIFGLALDIPFWITAWPVLTIAAAAILVTRRAWMDRRSSFRRTVLRVTCVAIPLLCLWPLSAAWRAYQIPDIRGVISDHDGYSVTHSAWGQAWDRFSKLPIPDSAIQFAPAMSPEKLKTAVAAINDILAYDLSSPNFHLPPKLRHPWSRYPVVPMAFTQIQAARQLGKTDPAAAMEKLTQGFRIIRFLTREATSWTQWRLCRTMLLLLTQEVHVIAADDRLSVEELAETTDLFENELNSVNSSPLAANRLAVYEQLMLRYGYLWELSKNKEISVPNEVIDRSFPERIRMLRLVQLAGNDYAKSQFGPEQFPKMFRRWSHTTPHIDQTDIGEEMNMADSSAGSWSYYDQLERDALNAHRATVTILRLQKYRRDHGEFPASLHVLLYGNSDEPRTFFNEQGLVTNWDQQTQFTRNADNLQHFEYLPDGLGSTYLSNGDSSTRTFVDPEQPVLRGPRATMTGSPTDPADWSRLHYRMLRPDPNRITYIDGSFSPIGGERIEMDHATVESRESGK